MSRPRNWALFYCRDYTPQGNAGRGRGRGSVSTLLQGLYRDKYMHKTKTNFVRFLKTFTLAHTQPLYVSYLPCNLAFCKKNRVISVTRKTLEQKPLVFAYHITFLSHESGISRYLPHLYHCIALGTMLSSTYYHIYWRTYSHLY